ncbi:unnamed protein product [Schistosoma mattheei]|uniref:Myb-like domain-containing protein n=1 Tax=Schistosoma mattheei TaxID=31246 RepID=A0AA85ATF6_9TREM|nr:unnamed protein product [Schistosoma mattheei]
MDGVVMITPSYNFVKSIHRSLSETNNISYLKLLTDSLLVLDVGQEFSLTFADIHGLKVIFLDTFVEWTCQFASLLPASLSDNTGGIRMAGIVNDIVMETLAFTNNITNELKLGYSDVPKPLMDFSNHLKFLMKTSSRRAFGWIDYCCKLRSYCSRMLHCIKLTNTSLDLNKADNKNLPSLANIQQHLLKLSSVFITLDTLRRFSDEIPLEQLQTPVILADSKGLKHTPIISGNENADMDCERKGRKLVDKCCFEQFCGPSPSTSTCTPVPEEKKKVRKYIIRLPKEEWKSHKTPWTIEESIALWHGVMYAPGSKSWSQIWHQSFRHSNRSQVNLKDRWRVIDNSETIKNVIRQAYISWTSQFTNGKGSPVRYNSLPMPVIVRTCHQLNLCIF